MGHHCAHDRLVDLWHAPVPSLTYQLSLMHDLYHWHQKHEHVHTTLSYPAAPILPSPVHGTSVGSSIKEVSLSHIFSRSQSRPACDQRHRDFFKSTSRYGCLSAGLNPSTSARPRIDLQNLPFSPSAFSFLSYHETN